ncbi:hypothetical protein [Mucilaginibacter flavus]|uniref:hypothetical protein n=1 Tax=Mucilaginibacter flavus TaxID=931504 RepID=UPI0025B56201|nr:hypothetical protein [Mucilaginibacter flavus]MDN3581263.1 hypothetical protein [Mucilaginibacter flavus]
MKTLSLIKLAFNEVPRVLEASIVISSPRDEFNKEFCAPVSIEVNAPLFLFLRDILNMLTSNLQSVICFLNRISVDALVRITRHGQVRRYF